MDNPLSKITSKDWVYLGGAAASIIALVLFIVVQRRVQANPTSTVSDTPIAPGTTAAPPNYVTYNTPNYLAPPISQGSDLAPDVSNTSCCCANNDCAGPSPLATGNTFNSLTQLLDYYKSTNPFYVQGQQAALQTYAEYFATGQTYSRGAASLEV